MEEVVIGGVAGAAFGSGFGGLWGATIIGCVSNAAMAAANEKSSKVIFNSFIAGAFAAFFGFIVGQYLNKVWSGYDKLSFQDFYDLGRMDGSKLLSGTHALLATGLGMVPSVVSGLLRGVSKFIGNRLLEE